VSRLDNEGVTGRYPSSEGLAGDAVWGKRAAWVLLSGRIAAEPVTLAILDHPGNPGHPAYWHARGYGLFAANPFGHRAYSEGKEALDYALEPGRSVSLRHRLLILSGEVAAADVEARAREFAGEPVTTRGGAR
jgi:hypothetical protein